MLPILLLGIVYFAVLLFIISQGMSEQMISSDIIYCDSSKLAAAGATAGTFDDLPVVTIKKLDGEGVLIGFIALVISTIPTSGQSGIPILRVNSKDLGIVNQEFVLAMAETDAIATNDKEHPVFAELILFNPGSGKNLDNAKITFSISVNVSMTGGFDAVVGAIYSRGEPSKEYIDDLKLGLIPSVIGGAKAESDAGISAVASTSFAAGIDVTSDARELVGLLGFVIPNAPTAGENCVGIVEYTATQMDDFSPQRWPFFVGYTASLGTPVGTAVTANRRNGFYHPTRFKFPQVNFTMGVAMELVVALSNAGDGIAAAKWR